MLSIAWKWQQKTLNKLNLCLYKSNHNNNNNTLNNCNNSNSNKINNNHTKRVWIRKCKNNLMNSNKNKSINKIAIKKKINIS